jgi:hypothetical protein
MAQLVTLAQVKQRVFPVGLADAAEDALLTELIEQASDYMQELAGRGFTPEAGVTYLTDTAAGSTIPVARGIRAVTALLVARTDQPDDGTGTYTAIDAADILLRPSPIDRRPGWPATAIMLRGTSARLSEAINGAKITGDFGFVAVPPAVQAIALDAVAAAYTAKEAGDSDAIGADGSPVAVWARMFAPGTAQHDTLTRYRSAGGTSLGMA